MSLSSGLILTDLSDFLSPSQSCIKPATFIPSPPPIAKLSISITPLSSAPIPISLDDDDPPKKASITIADCLACSGCITSAESVLVSLQSHQEVYDILHSRPDLVPVLSISPQSLSSLAATHSLSPAKTLSSLRRFFKQHFGFALVFDTTFARELSLLEGRDEVMELRGKGKTILSSACPGWICYAEKTKGELLPLVSDVVSSQAAMGVLVKYGIVAKKLGLLPEQIYHVSVMPCYDKKLEASRPDFASPSLSSPDSDVKVRDTDCVLTTGEISLMLQEASWSLPSSSYLPSTPASTFPRSLPSPPPSTEDTYFPSLIPTPPLSSSSGGYLANTLSTILTSLPPSLLSTTKLKTLISKPDLEELLLYHLTEEGVEEPIWRGGKCYGFKNLQNLVKRVGRDNGITFSTSGGRAAAGRMVRGGGGGRGIRGRKKTGVEEEGKLDFVEIMACPSGCANGGGQLGGTEGVKGKEWVGRVEDKFREIGERERGGSSTSVASSSSSEDSSSPPPSAINSPTTSLEMEEDSPMEGIEESPLQEQNVDSSILPYLSQRNKHLEEFLKRVRGELGVEGRKRLRTGYREVEKVVVEGLAVKW